jgi:hypothetical protein
MGGANHGSPAPSTGTHGGHHHGTHGGHHGSMPSAGMAHGTHGDNHGSVPPVVELVEVTPQQSGAVSGMANVVATSSLLALVALVAVRRRQAMQRRDYTTLETV